MRAKVGMRVLIEQGPWAGHAGTVKEVDVRDMFIRVDLENGVESLTLPAMVRLVDGTTAEAQP